MFWSYDGSSLAPLSTWRIWVVYICIAHQILTPSHSYSDFFNSLKKKKTKKKVPWFFRFDEIHKYEFRNINQKNLLFLRSSDFIHYGGVWIPMSFRVNLNNSLYYTIPQIIERPKLNCGIKYTPSLCDTRTQNNTFKATWNYIHIHNHPCPCMFVTK